MITLTFIAVTDVLGNCIILGYVGNKLFGQTVFFMRCS